MSKENKLTRVSFGIYFFIASFFVLIRALSAFGLLNFMQGYVSYVFTFVVQVVLLFGGSVILFSVLSKQKVRQTLKLYKVNKVSARTIVFAVLAGIVVFFLNIFVSTFFNSIISAFGYTSERVSSSISSYPVWLLLVNIVFTALLPGICEEIAHRGMILNASSKFGYLKAIIISSLLFGLLHLNIEQFFYATLIGIYLGFLTTFSGSIIPAMIVHFMNNALSVFLTFSSVRGLSFAKIFTKLSLIFETNVFVGILFVILIMILLVYLLLGLSRMLVVSSLQDRAIEGREMIDRLIKRQIFFESTSKSKQELNLSQEDIENLFMSFERSKMDGVTKTFLILTIAMTSVLTIFTFVWGIL